MAANGSDVARKIIEANPIKLASAVLNCNKLGTITVLESGLTERFAISGVVPSLESRLDERFSFQDYYA